MRKNIFRFFVFALGFFVFSCKSFPTEISNDLDARQLIQAGQDNFDIKRYKAAQMYFEAVLERYGDDEKYFIEATYEIGHMQVKQKKFDAAISNFNEILELYEALPVGLPPAYKKLCEIELEKIPQKKAAEEKRHRRKFSKKSFQDES